MPAIKKRIVSVGEEHDDCPCPDPNMATMTKEELQHLVKDAEETVDKLSMLVARIKVIKEHN